jgi:hypothetical protein
VARPAGRISPLRFGSRLWARGSIRWRPEDVSMDDDTQAVVLLTNRLLLDWISISVDSGAMERGLAERLIDFSAAEVVRGAPELKEPTLRFAELFKSRLPPK